MQIRMGAPEGILGLLQRSNCITVLELFISAIPFIDTSTARSLPTFEIPGFKYLAEARYMIPRRNFPLPDGSRDTS